MHLEFCWLSVEGCAREAPFAVTCPWQGLAVGLRQPMSCAVTGPCFCMSKDRPWFFHVDTFLGIQVIPGHFGMLLLVVECDRFFLPTVLARNEIKGLSLCCTDCIASLVFYSPVRVSLFKAGEAVKIHYGFSEIYLYSRNYFIYCRIDSIFCNCYNSVQS